MTPAPKTVAVVAAVIQRGDRYLLARRPEHKRHGGLWEFPGGKVLEDESRLEAAKRELAEELDLAVVTLGACLLAVPDEGSPFVIEFFETRVEGELVAREHTDVSWFTLDELGALELAPADARFVAFLSREGPPPRGSAS